MISKLNKIKYVIIIVLILLVAKPEFVESKNHTIDSLLSFLQTNDFENITGGDSIYLYGIELSKNNNDQLALGLFNYHYGCYLHQVGQYSSSYSYLIESLDIFLELKIDSLVGESYRFLGESLRASKNFEQSLENLDKSIEIFKRIKNDYLLSKAYNRKAALYIELRMFDSLFHFINLSNDYIRKIDTNSEILVNNYNILAVYFKNRDYKKSLDYFNKAINIVERREDDSEASLIYSNLAFLYLENNQVDSAKKWALKAYNIADKFGVNTYKSASARVLARIYEGEGDYEAAYKYVRIHYRILDSVLNARAIQQKVVIEDKFNREENFRRISYENKLNFYRILVLAVALIFIIIIAIVLYIKQKEQLQKNRTLLENNEIINSQAEKLIEANKNKDLLFSIMVHDLRNPLSTLKMIGNILEDGFISLSDQDKEDFARDIVTTTKSANLLIDDLLLWSRAQRNMISAYYENTKPYEIIQRLIDILAPQTKVKELDIINNISSDMEFVSDSNMFSTIMRNLLSNSVKFSNYGATIIVEGELDKQKKSVTFIVEDHGVGMSKEELESIFKPGSVSNVGTAGEHGTGLGVLICRDFCNILNGKIWFESKLNIGTKAFVELPFGELLQEEIFLNSEQALE